MPRVSDTPPSVMPSRPELAALLAEHGLVECPPHRVQAIGTIGVVIATADPPAPPMNTLGQLGRDPVALRIGRTIVYRDAGEGLDQFRLRVAREFGGVGIVANHLYKPEERWDRM